ncbi:MAG TPA: hypothetical protein VEZ89_11065, partial [Rubrivivax sp.]|nr:hypothetical protein [Rubrivivax sp.]
MELSRPDALASSSLTVNQGPDRNVSTPVGADPSSQQAAWADERLVLRHERQRLLERIETWLEVPMLVLALAWLALLVVELIGGASRRFETVGMVIWGLFVAHFALEFVL